MTDYAKKMFGDMRGLSRICGSWVALRWTASVMRHLGTILRRGDLQPADRAMGSGPFEICMRNHALPFRIQGIGAISGIREMYVRDTYLHDGILTIHDGNCVVDLGANIGNFTNLALAHGQSVRIVAVEPSKTLNASFRESVGLNEGFLERARLVRAFVGQMGALQDELQDDPEYADAPWISEAELIKLAAIERIDFLKCDIEGGEFGLLHADSKLLAMTMSLAIEIHQFAGDVEAFMHMLRTCGFAILAIQRDPDGSATVLARRAKPTTDVTL